LAYQVAVWNEMKPARIAQLADQIGETFPGQVEFVRADHYFNLYNEAEGLPFNLALSANTKVRSDDGAPSAEHAADGTPATVWTSAKTGKSWLEFDFGDSHRLTRYVIRHAGASGLGREQNSRDITVEASADSRTWTTVHTVAGNKDDVTDVDLEPVDARYVKFIVNRAGADSTALRMPRSLAKLCTKAHHSNRVELRSKCDWLRRCFWWRSCLQASFPMPAAARRGQNRAV
jgi:hypothetical protein